MKKGDIERKILDHLLISGAVILALQHPANMSRFLRRLPRDLRRYKETQLRRALHRLKKQSRIEYLKEEGKIDIDGKFIDMLKQEDIDEETIKTLSLTDIDDAGGNLEE